MYRMSHTHMCINRHVSLLTWQLPVAFSHLLTPALLAEIQWPGAYERLATHLRKHYTAQAETNRQLLLLQCTMLHYTTMLDHAALISGKTERAQGARYTARSHSRCAALLQQSFRHNAVSPEDHTIL